jgi:hypothetical protein
LEFGSGESTIYASGVSTLNTITSVESSETFVNDHLKSNPAIASALTSGKLSFHLVDIGEIDQWGFPKDKSKIHLWPNYSLSIFSQKKDYDLVLVDGRFRVACTLNCILNLPDDCAILIHDFWNRLEYHEVLRFLKTVKQTDSLGVFKKKDVIEPKQVQSLIKAHQYLPSDKTLVKKIKKKLIMPFRSRYTPTA